MLLQYCSSLVFVRFFMLQGMTNPVLVPDQDTWFLRITQPASNAPSNAPPSLRWEKRKKPSNAPNPVRAGVTMVYRKISLPTSLMAKRS